MGELHKRLTRTRKGARRQRRKQIIHDFGDLSDEEYARVWQDHAAAARRRLTRAGKELRGEQRRARLSAILCAAILELGREFPKDYYWAGRLRHKKACERVAANLPTEAKRLFKRKEVSARTIRRYTASLTHYRIEDELRAKNCDIATQSGLLRQISEMAPS